MSILKDAIEAKKRREPFYKIFLQRNQKIQSLNEKNTARKQPGRIKTVGV